MKLDSILKALGVETIQDIECLTSHFLLASPDADPSTQLIAPNDVVKAIRAFVEENQNKPRIEEDQVSVDSPDELQATPSSERSYWDRFNTIVDDKKFRTWTAVYKGMEKYNGLLNERWHLSMDIGNVSRQNEELRGLLRQYMNAKVNDDLQVPPTRVMLAQAGLLH